MKGAKLFQAAGCFIISFCLCLCLTGAGASTAGSADFCVTAKAAEAELNKGMWHLTLHDFEAAIGSFNSGLTILSHDYLTATIEDDTDVKLKTADDMEGQGDLEGSAGMKRWVLSARLEHYKHKYRCG